MHPRYASWRDIAASEKRNASRRATSLLMVYGSKNDGLWFKNHGLWSQNHDLWFRNHGVWFKNYDSWFLVHGFDVQTSAIFHDFISVGGPHSEPRSTFCCADQRSRNKTGTRLGFRVKGLGLRLERSGLKFERLGIRVDSRVFTVHGLGTCGPAQRTQRAHRPPRAAAPPLPPPSTWFTVSA